LTKPGLDASHRVLRVMCISVNLYREVSQGEQSKSG